jgi:glycosyltransferase involved in cell wall biosynthesis
MDQTSVSIIISCRNEESFIGQCLDSILTQTWPQQLLEVVVVDGMSDDKTREVVQTYDATGLTVRLLENPRRLTPFAMNIGFRESCGDVKILVNAHSQLHPEFVANSVRTLEITGADAVGGMLETISTATDPAGQAIPLAADSPFGSGGRRYRSNPEPGFVEDTLPYCAYPQATLDRFGMIDEALTRDQDEELNYRILKNGGRIYFNPEIRSTLHIRSSLSKLWKQHYQYGYFKPLVVRKVGGKLTVRQMIPAIFVATLALGFFGGRFSKILRRGGQFALFSWLGAAFYFAHESAKENNRPEMTPWIVAAFATLHLSYGSGYLLGIRDFLIRRIDEKTDAIEMELTR